MCQTNLYTPRTGAPRALETMVDEEHTHTHTHTHDSLCNVFISQLTHNVLLLVLMMSEHIGPSLAVMGQW